MTAPVPAAGLRTLVVDDHEIVRLGVRHLLAGRGVVQEAQDVASALACLAQGPVDLLLLDLALGDDFGLTALPRLRSACPGMRVIVLSSLEEERFAERALQAGADGFVNKAALSGQLLVAVDSVMAGRVHLSPALQDRLLRRVGQPGGSRPALSDRELEVLRLIAEGLSTREIADTLNRSVKTIETHKQTLKSKLGADTPAQLLRQALQWFGEAA